MAVIILLSITCASPVIASSEAMKTMCVSNGSQKVCVTISERAPDFMGFPASAAGTKHFSNGNAVQIVEHLNKEQTVGAVVMVALIGGRVHILAVMVNYCPEGFANFDSTKKHLTDSYEDVQFTKTGKVSGVLTKVDAITNYNSFRGFIEGSGI
jgi:hypothetical protein